MPEEHFKRLALWQAATTAITDDFLRHCAALEHFGEDDNFTVCWPGDVHFIDRANPIPRDPYFEEMRARIRR
ncbi:hypothetical protein VB780_07245 [Leptolyngbya sp. CCNP1308]|uniref:hypothetical protein n=1 Tax=Leptolyngbya sp. CCNP1308 TaxID=3110255 RepID=UPI002B202CCB|nr:hypothetical protein [Leptolyngbya sp. CCNP1308]MEA5448357.1 hypothetical protein [Leptolyngbya sp. CCNP1308]